MALALDHVFCFVHSDGRDIAAVERAGFVVTKDPHSHRDQGTSCRVSVFPEHYLEWIWLRSRGEAEVHELRLDRRADWRTTDACPFGLGLRGPIEARDRGSFLPYHPHHWPKGHSPLLVHRLARPCLFTG